MSNEFSTLDEVRSVRNQLLHIGSVYLYKMPIVPKLFALNGVGTLFSNHIWKYEEIIYGKAMLILRICQTFNHDEIEIIPPRENRGIRK